MIEALKNDLSENFRTKYLKSKNHWMDSVANWIWQRKSNQ